MKANSKTKSPRRRLSKWPERVFMLLALVLILISLTTFALRRVMRACEDEGITREIMSTLAAVEHIEAAAGELSGFNVLIITTDTTRADHIGCYGNRNVETPVIDSLAREGILCAHAVTAHAANGFSLSQEDHCDIVNALVSARADVNRQNGLVCSWFASLPYGALRLVV